MRHPTVSVVTASLNALPGLKRTTASVRSQSFDVVEHIVIDGGSTDGTPEWLDRQGNEIIWISESDLGIADALNKGVRRASGEWILVLHAEDTFLGPDRLQKAIDHLRTDAGVVCFDVVFTTERGTRTLRTSGLSQRLNWKPFPHQGAFTHRRVFEELGEFDASMSICFDYDFFLRAYRAGVESDVLHIALTAMPDTGVSSRRDWGSLRGRLSEEMLVHRRHADGLAANALYWLYWPPYLAYRRARSWFSSPPATEMGEE